MRARPTLLIVSYHFAPSPLVGAKRFSFLAREFSRDDTLTLFAEAYENRKKPHTVTATFELREGSGRVMGSFVIEGKSVEKPKDPSVYRLNPNLDLEDVPPGRYVIHLDARSSLDKDDRKKIISRDIPFSVR